MILCVYHGSTFKEVNETQTRKITDYIAASFAEQEVIECYYSSHVLEIMERRNSPLISFQEALTSNYENDEIYILITNLMNGEEYQKIIETIKTIDIDNKVVSTPYLLDKSNVYNIAEAIVDKHNSTLFVGHGNDIDNSDYQRLNLLLNEDSNAVTTLKSDLDGVLAANFYNKNIILKPLMITNAYHAKRDIEVNLKNELIARDYKPVIELSPLCENEQVLGMFVENLKNIMN